MPDLDVIVIGAGLGGLTAAALAAQSGRSTLLLEQSSHIGGLCSTRELDGFRFDVGASIIEDIEVIDRVFRRLGTSLKAEVDLVPLDPIYTVILRDGTRIKRAASVDDFAREIEKFAPGDVRGWYEYADYMKGFLDIALNGFFISPANTMFDLMRMFLDRPQFFKYLPLFMKSYQEVMEHYFKDPRLLEMLGFLSLFTGLAPDLAPGPMAMLPFSEHLGFYYSQGGMIAIPEALRRQGLVKGVKLRTETRVRRIMVENGRAVGVVLADGTEISSRLVIGNINAQTLYFDLIGREHLPGLVVKGLESLEPSHVAAVLHLGVDYEPPLESHHTLITRPMTELNNYRHEVPTPRPFPIDQFGLISWPSRSDPALAPAGCHTLSITLTNAPYRLPESSYDESRIRITEDLVDYFSASYLPGLKDHLVTARLQTPLDYERDLCLPFGSTYCFKQDSATTTVFRPAAKSKVLKGLYLTGASTHPGGGVPSTMASGLIASDLIEKYER